MKKLQRKRLHSGSDSNPRDYITLEYQRKFSFLSNAKTRGTVKTLSTSARLQLNDHFREDLATKNGSMIEIMLVKRITFNAILVNMLVLGRP